MIGASPTAGNCIRKNRKSRAGTATTRVLPIVFERAATNGARIDPISPRTSANVTDNGQSLHLSAIDADGRADAWPVGRMLARLLRQIPYQVKPIEGLSFSAS